MSHQEVNRGYWADQAPDYAETARRDWAAAEPYWGIWKIPEADVGALPDVDGLDAIELGCGTAYFSAWLARRGARPVGIDQSPEQLATARAMQAEHGLEFPLIEGDAEAVPLPDASFDFALSEYGASLWCEPDALDRRGRAAAAPGRAARVPHQLAAAGPVLGAGLAGRRPTASRGRSSGSAASSGTTRTATRSSSTSPTARCCACCASTASRSRRCTSCRRRRTRPSRYEFVTPEWARQWPCEEIWVARRE